MSLAWPYAPVLLDASILTDDERELVAFLSRRLMDLRYHLELRDSYYDGEQVMKSLGIAIPPQLASLHTAIGWPRTAIDALDERMDIEGFRLPDSQDSDDELWEIWTANQMDQESQLAHLDMLIYGRAYVAVGSGACGPGGDCPPLITVESPLNMAVDWDARSRAIRAALQLYQFDGAEYAALYLPDETIQLYKDGTNQWAVQDRDRHGLGVVPVVRLANRQRTADRYGRSEITPELMSVTDAACRTLTGIEVAREFYSVPQRYILGATEEAFQDADGKPKTAWETYIGRILALERDEEGNVPQVGTFASYDPATYTSLIDMYGRIVGSMTGLPPHMLGFTTENPASADAIRSSEARLDKRALRKQRNTEGSWRDVQRLALLIRHGDLPANSHQIDVLWRDPSTPTPGATTDAVMKQVQMGYLPAESEVTGEKLGYDAVERARIRADRRRSTGRQVLAALGQAAAAVQPPPQEAPGGSGNPAAS